MYKYAVNGGLSWDLEALDFVNEVTGECIEETDDEEEKAYIQRLSGMVQFAQAGNGDIYALDIAETGEENPVLYWEHETGDIRYLADSFQSYVGAILELYAVGDEIWQLESFLGPKGLEPYGENALRWKLWFETFLNSKLDTEKQHLDTLISFTLVRKELDCHVKEAYQIYDKKDIFQIIKKKLLEQNHSDTERLLITMAAELTEDLAGKWAEELWDNITEYPSKASTDLRMGKYRFSSELLAYLSAACMEQEKAFYLVRDYLQKWLGSKLTGWEAFSHMRFFKRELVLPWMEQQNMLSPNGWDQLFISVRPNWSDMLKWSGEANKKKVLIDALTLMVEKKEELMVPRELPNKQIILDWLAALKEIEILNIRKRKIDKIVAKIDLLYE